MATQEREEEADVAGIAAGVKSKRSLRGYEANEAVVSAARSCSYWGLFYDSVRRAEVAVNGAHSALRPAETTFSSRKQTARSANEIGSMAREESQVNIR